MFTGIIQNQGLVTHKTQKGQQVSFSFQWQKKEEVPVTLGESIAVNGVCLTVSEKKKDSFQVDVIRETLEVTTLKFLGVGERVNLERSLRQGDVVGGHFVSGHVDGVAKLIRIETQGKNRTYWMRSRADLMRRVVAKASVSLDGVSLTIQSVGKDAFSVGLVPHTLLETNLRSKRTGMWLNLEIDLMMRYVETLFEGDNTGRKQSLENFLKRNEVENSSQSSKVSVVNLKKQGF